MRCGRFGLDKCLYSGFKKAGRALGAVRVGVEVETTGNIGYGGSTGPPRLSKVEGAKFGL